MIYIRSHRLPDGVGTNGVFTEGAHFPYMLPYVALSKCARVATFCHMLPHVVIC